MITFSDTVRALRLLAMCARLDSGITPGRVRIYRAPRPAPGDTATGELATVTLPRPSAGSIVDGVLTFSEAETAQVHASGVASWARFESGDGEYVADCDVGLSGSGAEIILSGDSLHLYAGGELTLTIASLAELPP